jgi:hypothetical protein
MPYIKEYKVKFQIFVSFLPQSYKDRIEFDNPKTLNEVIRKEIIFYEQYRQRYEKPKA